MEWPETSHCSRTSTGQWPSQLPVLLPFDHTLGVNLLNSINNNELDSTTTIWTILNWALQQYSYNGEAYNMRVGEKKEINANRQYQYIVCLLWPKINVYHPIKILIKARRQRRRLAVLRSHKGHRTNLKSQKLLPIWYKRSLETTRLWRIKM